MAFSKALVDKRPFIHCDHCFKNITLHPFIKCAEPECAWDLCLICFFSCSEVGCLHKNHNFRIVSNLDKPLFDDGWRAIDELLLLDGIETAGIGNFEDISTFIPHKGECEVRRHCFKILEITNNEEKEVYGREPENSDPNDPVVLSYLPKRGDFESEIINDFEAMVCNIHFDEIDAPLNSRIRQDLLRQYKLIMKQRVIWKNYILDRNLVDVLRLKRLELGEIGVVINKCKWIVQYISKDDFNKFIGGLVSELRLRIARSRRSTDELIDKAKLNNIEMMLSSKEKELCKKLHMSSTLYAQLKRLAIECYCARRPLRMFLFKLFAKSKAQRIEVIYRWFKRQNIVIGVGKSRCY
ncbi:transcriptional adapter 2-alpha [Pancytospora epiphaga]|nr:transcriptional adapter 2-alpha [Pancytospora epiphaga]